jgi:hypothetical protein
VAEGIARLLGWFFITLADLAAIDHYVVFVGDAIDSDCAEGKRIEAHAHLRRYYTYMSWTANVTALIYRIIPRSIEFYKKLGFELLYGGEHSAFSSMKASVSRRVERAWWPPSGS